MKHLHIFMLVLPGFSPVCLACSTTSANTGTAPKEPLARTTIQSVIRSHEAEIRDCYETGLLQKADLKGKLNVSWSVLSDGSVADVAIVENTLRNQEVEQCILNRVALWKFPEHSGADRTAVNYPFEFDYSTGESGIASGQRKNPPASEKSSGSGVTYILDDAIIHSAVTEHTEELTNCYASEMENVKGLKGRINVSWVVMGDGSVSDAKITESTMNNKNVETCVLEGVRKWKFPATGTKAEVSYPFEFESSTNR